MKETRIPTFNWKKQTAEDNRQEEIQGAIDAINKWLEYLPCPMTFWKNGGQWYLKEIPPQVILDQLGYGGGSLIYAIKIELLTKQKCFIEYGLSGEKMHVTTLNGNSFCINHSLTFSVRRRFSRAGNTHTVFYFPTPDVSMATACEAIGDYMSTTRDYHFSLFHPKHSLDAIDSSDRLLKSLDIIPTPKYMHEKSRYKAGEVIREADRLLIETIDPPTVCYIRTLLPATFNNMRAAEERGRFSLDRFF